LPIHVARSHQSLISNVQLSIRTYVLYVSSAAAVPERAHGHIPNVPGWSQPASMHHRKSNDTNNLRLGTIVAAMTAANPHLMAGLALVSAGTWLGRARRKLHVWLRSAAAAGQCPDLTFKLAALALFCDELNI
jgi:hypothetical protein